MSGGKGGKSSKGPSMQEQLAAQKQAIEMSRPSQLNLQTQGYGGMGYNMPDKPFQMGTPQTGQGLTPPDWMQGDWAMPAWGKEAPNVGAALLMQRLGQDAYRQQYMQPQGLPGGTAQGPSDWMKNLVNQQASGRRGGKGHLVTGQNGGSYWSVLPQQWEQRNGIGNTQDIFSRAASGLAAAPQGGASPYAGMPLQEQLRLMFSTGMGLPQG